MTFDASPAYDASEKKKRGETVPSAEALKTVGQWFEMYRTHLRNILVKSFHFWGDDLDEVEQRCWVNAMNRFSSYDPKKGDPMAWLTMVAKSTSADYFRQQARQNKRNMRLRYGEQEQSFDVPDRSVEHEVSHEVREDLYAVLERMPEKYAFPIVLRLQGFSAEQIGKVLDISRNTVQNRLNKGQQMLREEYPEFGKAA